MAKSTAPILLTGGITFLNEWLGNGHAPTSELKVLLATGIAAGGLALIEQIPGMQPIAVGIAWIAFITMMIAPVNGNSPIQNLSKVTGI
jgi:hypothetical protein